MKEIDINASNFIAINSSIKNGCMNDTEVLNVVKNPEIVEVDEPT